MNSSRPFPGQVLSTLMLMVVTFIIGIFVGAQFSTTLAQDSTSPPPEAREAFAAFWQTYNLIRSEYLDPVETRTLVDGAINGMVNALGDEYSGYMDPDVFPMLNDDLGGEISGIGVVIRTNDNSLIEVVGLLEGSPAEAAGILPGDIFARVDGQDVTGISQMELAMRVRGPVGTTVEITMLRGSQLVDFSIVRAAISIPDVRSERLEGDLGYIALAQFSPDARQEIEAALDKLDPATLQGLIIDLRGNGGGLFDSAVDVASLLIDSGTILYEDFGDREITIRARGNAVDLGELPVVLLVDELSASASEIVAGAWKDYGAATLIGETTFGKGTVQTWNTLVNGGGVRLTIARWLTPDRSWIHNQGITPDIEVVWTPMTAEEAEIDLQLQAAIDLLLGQPAAAMPAS